MPPSLSCAHELLSCFRSSWEMERLEAELLSPESSACAVIVGARCIA